MIKTVNPQYIDSNKSFYDAAMAIHAQGFFSGYYSFEPCADVAEGAIKTRALFETSGLFPVGFRMPIDISEPDIEFEAALLALEPTIRIAAECGYRKALTWVMPGCETLPFTAYRAMLVRRLQSMCGALARYGIALGIEMVAPKTLQESYRYPAPCRLEDLFRLIQAADCANLGIILDSFHFFCAGHTPEEYALVTRADQVVMAHISDGVAGRSAGRQLDLERRLPGETGVIDCRAMLRHLLALGYSGAVIPEPLGSFADLPFSGALERTAKAVSNVWPS